MGIRAAVVVATSQKGGRAESQREEGQDVLRGPLGRYEADKRGEDAIESEGKNEKNAYQGIIGSSSSAKNQILTASHGKAALDSLYSSFPLVHSQDYLTAATNKRADITVQPTMLS